MQRWTVFPYDVECGAATERHVIPAGHPVSVVGTAIRRCQRHSHVEVDWAQVDAAQHELDAAAAEREQRSAISTPLQDPRNLTDRRASSATSASAVQRSFPRMFDPKAAAAGDYEP